MRYEREVGAGGGSRRWRGAERQEASRRGAAASSRGAWSKRDVVIAAAGGERVGEGGVVDLDGVVHLSDGVEDVVRGPDAGWSSGDGIGLVGGVEVGVL